MLVEDRDFFGNVVIIAVLWINLDLSWYVLSRNGTDLPMLAHALFITQFAFGRTYKTIFSTPNEPPTL